MTYNVFDGTLNPTLLLLRSASSGSRDENFCKQPTLQDIHKILLVEENGSRSLTYGEFKF